MSYITREQLAECEAAYEASYARTTTAATHFFDWTFRLIETLKAYQAEHGDLTEFSVHLEPEPERKIWFPPINNDGDYIWPDGSGVYSSDLAPGKWYAESSWNGLFETCESAAQWLFDRQLGPYHPEPKQ